MENCKIGVVGLAVMGGNLARNFASRGIRTAVFNRTYARTEELVGKHAAEYKDAEGGSNLVGFEEMEKLVEGLEKPRKIVLMVKENGVDEVLAQLLKLVEPGDFIIDGGNSFYEATERRHKEAAVSGVTFLGMGVSGGEEGALKGPSLMPGLGSADWPVFDGILGEIAAKDFEGRPCVAAMGPGGAGHFVKMVHNGIEYAVMQMIAEIYDFNRKAGGLSAGEIGKIFEKINSGEGESFLAEITAKVLGHKDSETGKAMVEVILDKAAQKGTGGWTSIEGIKLGAAAEMIGEAVAARNISSNRSGRVGGEAFYPREVTKSAISINWEKVYVFGLLTAFGQGLELLRMAYDKYNWAGDEYVKNWIPNLAEICRIWQGGCIIRSKLLTDLREVFLEHADTYNILMNHKIAGLVKDAYPEMQKLVSEAALCGVAVPVMASGLNYFLGITDDHSPANLIQGLRDFFGAHTFERVDKQGVFHENWNN